MRKYTKKPWSTSERKLLSEKYYNLPKQEVYELFPDRTPNAIRKQVLYLKARGWHFKT